MSGDPSACHKKERGEIEWNCKYHDAVLKLLFHVCACWVAMNNSLPTLSLGKQTNKQKTCKHHSSRLKSYRTKSRWRKGFYLQMIILSSPKGNKKGENHWVRSELYALMPNLYCPASGDGLTWLLDAALVVGEEQVFLYPQGSSGWSYSKIDRTQISKRT